MNCDCGRPAISKDGSGNRCARCAKLESDRRQREARYEWKKQQAARAAAGLAKYEGRGSALKLALCWEKAWESELDPNRIPGWAFPAVLDKINRIGPTP
jgi:hypothetical protein